MLSCLWDGTYKRSLAANLPVHVVAAAGFLSRCLNGPEYVRRHMTVNILFNDALNTFYLHYMASDIG